VEKNVLSPRNVQIHFAATEDEAALIKNRMARMGVKHISAYLRKVAIDGYYISIDLSEVKELVSLLRRCSNNLNQYAKRANETGSIYEGDIEDLRAQFDKMWEAANSILTSLSKIK
jgi:hypothetical protein